jgi:RHH-type proline utilization regulon transcriptional repressor/proline dehydrogenase/delta 1-pyrroline-5-carboxylate dehydrogenase
VEAELQRVGRSIHAAFPGRTRNPLRALDQKAMELASQDMELRAALFRFVDVTPACRSLDDLARHLTGYLDEVDTRPPPIEAAMKMSGTKAGRAALGAAAAAGVRRMAHRFIVGETPRARPPSPRPRRTATRRAASTPSRR